MTSTAYFQVLLCLFSPFAVYSFCIEPGVVVERKGTMIVLFETTEFGAGGLVFNQPSPIRLADLSIPKFRAFDDNFLMLGRELLSSDEGGSSSVAVGDMAPWFWLHNVEYLSRSSRLGGSSEPLFMGGNIEEASELVLSGKVDPTQFKFFHKYTIWEGTKLDQELEEGKLRYRGPASASEVLRPYSLRIV